MADPALRTAAALLWRGLRPLLRWLFLALALIEAALRSLGRGAARAATVGATVLTPRRAIGLTIAAAGGLLVVSQFVDYHGVQIGGSAAFAAPPGVQVAPPPTVDLRTAGQAHSYVLVPVGAIVVVLGLAMIARGGRVGRLAALGAILAGAASLAVILLIDLPHGTDVGSQSSRFAGASAVLEKGFAAELAAAGGVLLGGVLYYARPCLIRISLSGRGVSARRRRPRRRASSRARVARSA
ncbi:MAG TPA: hypothetical protein VHZ54_14070 [Solirubrobacterales bacterium]|jgi:hypothetical protein|nr:hypothetical protein [Solirubrobacterales bacterium]